MRRLAKLVVVCALSSFPVRAAELRVGLYPLSLPAAEEGVAARLTAQLHEGASALPGLQAFDVLPKSSCAPAEGGCLAGAAQRSGVDRVVSAQIEAIDGGYRLHLRSFSADGAAGPAVRRDVSGDALDLGGALENAVCQVLGAAPCLSALRVRGDATVDGEHLFVDGEDVGPLPLAAPLKLAVGEHALRLGRDDRRLRFSYARTVRLAATRRSGEPALLEDSLLPAPPLTSEATLQPEPRQTAAFALATLGAGLLLASGGTALYAHVASDAAGAPRPGVHTAQVLSIAFAASGAGALFASGVVWALAPNGVAIAGSF